MRVLAGAVGLILLFGQGWPPRNGSALPATCATGETYYLSTSTYTKPYECTATNTWSAVSPSSGEGASLPAGAVVLIVSGSCPSGFVEESSLNGKFVLGTVGANADIGTTGGSNDITSVLNHTHTVNVNDPGHNHTQNPHQHGMAEGQTDGAGTFMDRSNAASAATAVTDNATATNQSATTGVTATTANPAGGVASIDNRPAFARVIFCRKT